MVSSAEKLTEFIEDDSTVGRVAATLSGCDFPVVPSRLAALQLVGGVPFDQPAGGPLRSEIHLLIVAGSEYPTAQFCRRFADLAEGAEVVNGDASTRAGLVGSTSGDSISRGPVTDEAVDFTVVKNADQFDTGTVNALAEVLEVGEFSIANANVRETVDAPGSLLLFAKPKYGGWDMYEPVEDQTATSQTLLDKVDVATTVNTDQAAPDRDLQVEAAQARYAISEARKIEPSIPEEVRQEAENDAEVLVGDRKANTDAYLRPSNQAPVRSILRLAAAEAKYAGREEVTSQDRANASSLMLLSYLTSSMDVLNQTPGDRETDAETDDAGLDEQVRAAVAKVEDKYEGGAPKDVVLNTVLCYTDARVGAIRETISNLKQVGGLHEPKKGHLATTGTIDSNALRRGSSTQRDGWRTIKSLIGEVEEEYDEGAPIEEVKQKADENGLLVSGVEKEVERLRRAGELYEPVQNHLRTT